MYGNRKTILVNRIIAQWVSPLSLFDLAKCEYLNKRIVHSLYENVQVGKENVLSRYERLSVCTIILPVTRRLRTGGKFVVSN